MTELGSKYENKSAKRLTPIVFALDEDWQKCQIWIDRLKSKVWGFKVGSILYAERGPGLVEELKSQGSRVFLDLKLHDIPRTVQHSVRQAFRHGADWITLHATGGRAMLEAAAQEQSDERSLLAVSVLTSLDDAALHELGYQFTSEKLVLHLSELAMRSGIHGLISSIHEVGLLRQKYSEALLVTPGVRLQASGDDQKRTGTLLEAFQKGASYAVLGRALYESSDWEKTWENIQSTLAATP